MESLSVWFWGLNGFSTWPELEGLEDGGRGGGLMIGLVRIRGSGRRIVDSMMFDVFRAREIICLLG